MTHPQVVENAATQFKNLSAIFIALGDETRQQIVLTLAKAGPEGMNVSDITVVR